MAPSQIMPEVIAMAFTRYGQFPQSRLRPGRRSRHRRRAGADGSAVGGEASDVFFLVEGNQVADGQSPQKLLIADMIFLAYAITGRETVIP